MYFQCNEAGELKNNLNAITIVFPISIVTDDINEFEKVKKTLDNTGSIKLSEFMVDNIHKYFNKNKTFPITVCQLYGLEDFAEREMDYKLENFSMAIINRKEFLENQPITYNYIYSSTGELHPEFKPIFKNFDFNASDSSEKRLFVLHFVQPLILVFNEGDEEIILDKIFDSLIKLIGHNSVKLLAKTIKELYGFAENTHITDWPPCFPGNLPEMSERFQKQISETLKGSDIKLSKIPVNHSMLHPRDLCYCGSGKQFKNCCGKQKNKFNLN